MSKPPTYQARVQALDATRADVRLIFDDLPSETEVRGRLMGPRCPDVGTVEVAYRLRPVPGRAHEYQVLIPEPCLWEPERPFRYEGPVELWRHEELTATLTVSVALRLPTS